MQMSHDKYSGQGLSHTRL